MMQIFYTYTDKILSNVGIDKLKKYSDDRSYVSENKNIEHLCGLYLICFIAENFFNISNPKIMTNDGKPYFVNSDIKFSLSHSNGLIAVAFSQNNIGLDVEYMKLRDFDKLAKRYNKKFTDKISFYSFWTDFEAVYKLNESCYSKLCTIIDEMYFLTCVSDSVMTSDFRVKLL